MPAGSAWRLPCRCRSALATDGLDAMDLAYRLIPVASYCSHQASWVALGLLCRCRSVLPAATEVNNPGSQQCLLTLVQEANGLRPDGVWKGSILHGGVIVLLYELVYWHLL